MIFFNEVLQQQQQQRELPKNTTTTQKYRKFYFNYFNSLHAFYGSVIVSNGNER